MNEDIVRKLPDLPMDVGARVDAIGSEDLPSEWQRVIRENAGVMQRRTPRPERKCGRCGGRGHDRRNCKAAAEKQETPTWIEEALPPKRPSFIEKEATPAEKRVWKLHVGHVRHIGAKKMRDIITKDLRDISAVEAREAMTLADQVGAECQQCQGRRPVAKDGKGYPAMRPYTSHLGGGGQLRGDRMFHEVQLDHFKWREGRRERMVFLVMIDTTTQLLVVAACHSEEGLAPTSAACAWEAFIRIFVLRWGLPNSIKFDAGLGKIGATTATPFTQDAPRLGIGVTNRIPNRPQSMGLVERANAHVAEVLDRLYMDSEIAGKLTSQEMGDLAALEWNAQLKAVGSVAPSEMVSGQRWHAKAAALFSDEKVAPAPQVARMSVPDELDGVRRMTMQARIATAEAGACKLYVAQREPDRPLRGDWVMALLIGAKWSRLKAKCPKSRVGWEGPYLVDEVDTHEVTVQAAEGKSCKFPLAAVRVVRRIRNKAGNLLIPVVETGERSERKDLI